eukprot:2404465-Rhodomonas_salina.1
MCSDLLCPIVLRACYAKSGTEVGYGGAGRSLCSYASSSESDAEPEARPVVPGTGVWCCAMPGTGVAYGAIVWYQEASTAAPTGSHPAGTEVSTGSTEISTVSNAGTEVRPGTEGASAGSKAATVGGQGAADRWLSPSSLRPRYAMSGTTDTAYGAIGLRAMPRAVLT